jgi:hypothetical protein
VFASSLMPGLSNAAASESNGRATEVASSELPAPLASLNVTFADSG